MSLLTKQEMRDITIHFLTPYYTLEALSVLSDSELRDLYRDMRCRVYTELTLDSDDMD